MTSVQPRTTAAAPAAAPALPMTSAPLPGATPAPMPGMGGSIPISPYDGTSPVLGPGAGLGGMPLGAGQLSGAYGEQLPIGAGSLMGGMVPGGLGGQGSTTAPQINATNQTALAPNGDVSQQVTNQNQYTNRYYNIIVPNGALGGLGGLGGWNQPGNSFIDPQTGVLYVQQSTGILGWFKRLFQGF